MGLVGLWARNLGWGVAWGFLDRVQAAWGYGTAAVALMGLSAARLHGGLPRALGVAVVAVPKQRPPVRLLDREATVVFARRSVDQLGRIWAGWW